MIIKKPYAFLIRYFKIINVVLLMLMSYFTYRYGIIAMFLRRYVNDSYTTQETNLLGNYLSIIMFIILIAIIVINSIIFFLMKSKNKDAKLYNYSIIYYVVLFILLLLYYSVLSSINLGNASPSFVRFVKEISTISILPSYIFIILVLFNVLGFNIKTLRFDNNFDLRITESDEEEIEVNILSNEISTKKTIVHYFRELKYYFLENKIIIYFVVGFLIIFLLTNLFIKFLNNKTYNINDSFSLNNITYSVKESYLTKTDYLGNEIAPNKTFLVIKLFISNNSPFGKRINSSTFRIYNNDNKIYPSYDRASRFIDIGKPYSGEEIPGNSSEDYVFAYELEDKDIASKYKMRILSNLAKSSQELIPSYKKINIFPEDLSKKNNMGTYSLNETVTFAKTLLGKTELELKDVQIKNYYEYETEQCITINNCQKRIATLVPQYGKILIIIKDDIKWDETTAYYKNSKKDIYEDLTKINVAFQGNSKLKEYNATLKNVTPKQVQNVKIYEASNLIQQGNTMKFVINVHNSNIYINIS